MKKTVNCRYWKEYDSLNGWVMFCSAGAFARKLSRQEAESCGCIPAQRAVCMKVMESHLGYGLVPEVAAEQAKEVIAAGEKVLAASS